MPRSARPGPARLALSAAFAAVGLLAGCRPGDRGWDTLHNLGNRLDGDEDREHERQVFAAWRTDASLPRPDGVPLVIK